MLIEIAFLSTRERKSKEQVNINSPVQKKNKSNCRQKRDEIQPFSASNCEIRTVFLLAAHPKTAWTGNSRSVLGAKARKDTQGDAALAGLGTIPLAGASSPEANLREPRTYNVPAAHRLTRTSPFAQNSTQKAPLPRRQRGKELRGGSKKAPIKRNLREREPKNAYFRRSQAAVMRRMASTLCSSLVA